ncbi:MerR family transcriptional regulator [Actinokineospora iranica]|uniref:DNA-binding transcriptional regulator, MerR family n=1 Tax=Actinokineospora iranica TaxID=1271860 RepID=A0A1G6JTT3_9PSEU|nr:MerR family transcriptional regulator [Actinokineospora iranica]SDC22088.1 DNA-binding transcriptional regulator, MerR family [Actinokineospora iranica]
MLTISQLAATAGVTVRAVRHYHQVGLLPEPERDASGYRRYPARAAVDLIRIKTLADAGVPLARIDALLHAQPTEFASAIADIDAELRRRIGQLTEYRRRIADLAGGERLSCRPKWSPSWTGCAASASASAGCCSNATRGFCCARWTRAPCRFPDLRGVTGLAAHCRGTHPPRSAAHR